MRIDRVIKELVKLFLLLVLVIVILYSGMKVLDATALYGEAEPAGLRTTKTIVRDGQAYFPRQDITVVMVLGIDRSGPVESSNYYRNDGSADTVMLLVFDETEKNCTVLNLNRDTMVDMDVLGVRGEPAGTDYGQLGLAHTYGTGLEDSCENVRNTLMHFIHGLTVDYYVAMNMDALAILNDAVGGVTVTVTEDFSQVNPTITLGELTLMGDQALDYVRSRKEVGDQKNITRMERQEAYVTGFLEALKVKEQADANFALEVYEQVAPYVVSDCSATTLTSMLERYTEYEVREVVTPEGENTIVDGYYEFHVDEEIMDSLILELFYRPK